MTKREKLLAAGVLALLVLVGLRSLLGRYNDLIDRREAQLLDAKKQLLDAETALTRGHMAVKKLEAWQDRSLPDDREVAMSLYRSWLLDQCKAAGLTVDDVNPDARSARTAAYNSVGYVVEARGSLASVVSLLYEFYRSAQLQQITRLRLRPSTDPAQLAVTLRVEALILPGATNTDKLPEGISNRLKLASADEYRQELVDRNLFAVYTPPQPAQSLNVAQQEKPSPPPFDDAKFAVFTGTVGNGDAYQAWITVRTTGEVLRLSKGDAIKVGLFEGDIVKVDPRVLVVQSEGKKFRIDLGKSLRDGTQIKTDGEAPSDSAVDPSKT